MRWSGRAGVNLWSLNAAVLYVVQQQGRSRHHRRQRTQGPSMEIATVFEPSTSSASADPFRDMRDAGYANFPERRPAADQARGRNLWRERTVISDENPTERWVTPGRKSNLTPRPATH